LRVVFSLCLMLSLGGCSLWNWLGWPDWFDSDPCEFCALAPDEAFTPQDSGGLLVLGVTVRSEPAPEFEGAVTWLVETRPGGFADLRAVTLPEDLQLGQHYWLVWRAPAGTWSLRQARWKAGERGGNSMPSGGRVLAATVTAGVATYVGEITVDARQPTTVAIGNDGAAALAALAHWPAVKVPLINRPLRDLRRQRDE